MRLAVDKQAEYARELVHQLAPQLGDVLVSGLLTLSQTSEREIAEQRGEWPNSRQDSRACSRH